MPHDDPIEQLAALAFFQGPGAQANELIQQVRRQIEQQSGKAISYEVPLLDGDWGRVMQQVAPRLALYLHEKRLGLESRSLFLTIFIDQQVHFVQVSDFFDLVRRHEGVDPQTFEVMLQQWQRTGRRTSGLLPGPA